MPLSKITLSLIATLKINRATFLMGRDEVGGMLEFDSNMKNGLLVKDVHFIKQRVTTASVQFDDDAMAEYAERMSIDRNLPPELWRCGWWHHHPFQSATPSGTDWNTTEKQFGPSVCPNFSVMLITSEADPSCHIRMNSGPLTVVQSIPVDFDWDGLNTIPGFEKFDEDLTPLVSKGSYGHTSVVNSTGGATVNHRSSYYQDPRLKNYYVDRKDRTYYDKEKNYWVKLPDDFIMLGEEDPTIPPPFTPSGTTALDYVKGTNTTLKIASTLPPSRPAKDKAFNLNMASPIKRDDAVALAYKLYDCVPTTNPKWACALWDIYRRLSTGDREMTSIILETLDPDLVPLDNTLGIFVKAFKYSSDKNAFHRLLESDQKACRETIVAQAEFDDARHSRRERKKNAGNDPHILQAESPIPSAFSVPGSTRPEVLRLA